MQIFKYLLIIFVVTLVGCGKDGAHAEPPITPEPDLTLINGIKATDDDLMLHPVTWLGFCTSTIIGKRVVVTAAHCVTSGRTYEFRVKYGPQKGQLYKAKFYNTPLWPRTVHDISVGYMDRDYEGVPASIHTDRLEIGDAVTLTGYGCTRPGGGGAGNDGVLRYGRSGVVSRGRWDFVTRDLDRPGAALCYGDSGGPVFYDGKLAGINSRGNISTTSYLTRMDLSETADFLKKWSDANGAKICGFNADAEDCGGQEPPPGPALIVLENDVLKVSIEMKDAIKHSEKAVKALFTMIMDYILNSEPMAEPPNELLLSREKPAYLPNLEPVNP